MLTVGQVYNKNGREFCVLQLINFNSKQYVLMSAEHDKLEFMFYEVLYNSGVYHLELVVDQKLEYNLFNIIENEKE